MVAGDLKGSREQVTEPEEESKVNYPELSAAVLNKLEELYLVGKLRREDLDDRAVLALKQLSEEDALDILNKLVEKNLDRVSNKSAYLCSIMRATRNKSRHQRSSLSCTTEMGPDEGKLADILSRTGYTLDVTAGQRKYGGPPPDWEEPSPGKGCQLYCGNIPRDMYEDVLIPMFEKCGKIWDLRLMMDGSMTGLNRGYAFVTFTSPDEALKAVQELHHHEIAPGKQLVVNVSISNTRLFVGNIPKSKSKEEIKNEFDKYGGGLTDVFIYATNEKNVQRPNRGFCFLEYKTHQGANQAKKSLSSGRARVWGCDIIVDWADPQEEPDKETMDRVKILYCSNIAVSVTVEMLSLTFQRYGKVERVKKIKDYAFVHFEKRDEALEAMNGLTGVDLCGFKLEISWAKPPSDKKKKEEMLRRREQRMMESMAKSMTYPPDHDHYEYYDLHVHDILDRGDGGGWGYNVDNSQAAHAGRGSLIPGRARDYSSQNWRTEQSHPGDKGNMYVGNQVFREGYMTQAGYGRGAALQERGHNYKGWGRVYQGGGGRRGHGGCFTFGEERRRGSSKRL